MIAHMVHIDDHAESHHFPDSGFTKIGEAELVLLPAGNIVIHIPGRIGREQAFDDAELLNTSQLRDRAKISAGKIKVQRRRVRNFRDAVKQPVDTRDGCIHRARRRNTVRKAERITDARICGRFYIKHQSRRYGIT